MALAPAVGLVEVDSNASINSIVDLSSSVSAATSTYKLLTYAGEQTSTSAPPFQSSALTGMSGSLLSDAWTDSTAGVTTILEAVLRTLLHNRILLPDPNALRTYLWHRLDTIVPVLRACGMTLACFGARGQLSLEVAYDRDGSGEDLMLYVRQRPYDPNIMDQIDMLRDQTEAFFRGEQAGLHVTTDFQSPR